MRRIKRFSTKVVDIVGLTVISLESLFAEIGW
jgi:hypothetical protein